MPRATDTLPGLPLALKNGDERSLKNAGFGLMAKRRSGTTSHALENKAIKKLLAANSRADLNLRLSRHLIFSRFRFCLPLLEALL